MGRKLRAARNKRQASIGETESAREKKGGEKTRARVREKELVKMTERDEERGETAAADLYIFLLYYSSAESGRKTGALRTSCERERERAAAVGQLTARNTTVRCGHLSPVVTLRNKTRRAPEWKGRAEGGGACGVALRCPRAFILHSPSASSFFAPFRFVFYWCTLSLSFSLRLARAALSFARARGASLIFHRFSYHSPLGRALLLSATYTILLRLSRYVVPHVSISSSARAWEDDGCLRLPFFACFFPLSRSRLDRISFLYTRAFICVVKLEVYRVSPICILISPGVFGYRV